MIYYELWLKFKVYKKNLCFDQNLLCFVSPYLPKSYLVLVPYNKTNIPCLFYLISKLSTLGISDIKQKGMEYLLIMRKKDKTMLG